MSEPNEGTTGVAPVRFFREELYWLLPIIIATFAVTSWLLLNPRWGADIAAIIVIPINVAAVLTPLLFGYSARGGDLLNWRRSGSRKLKVAIAFTMIALIFSSTVYWLTREPNPREYLSGTVRIGVTAEDYPGWNASENNKRKGFDVALAESLAEYFGFTPEYVPISRKDRIEDLATGKDDIKLVIDNFSITPEREGQIDFAGPYFVDSQGFFTWNSAGNLEDIPPGKVCVPSDTTAQDRLVKYYGWQPTPEPSLAKCVERLLDRNDPTLAVSTDSAILQAYAQRRGIQAPAPIQLGLEKYGVGIPNNRPRLCEEVNKAIEDFILYKWDSAFRENLQGLSPDNRRPVSIPECKSPAFWGNT